MRDMVSSILAFNAKRGFAAFGRESVSSDEEFIRNLRPAVLQIVNSWRERGGRAYLLRYEDVVLRPEETLRHVVDYLGLQADEQGARRMLEYAGATGEAPERHRTTENAAESVGRWQRDLDPELQKLCAETFGDLLPVLGYE
jgi:hypothetical protein